MSKSTPDTARITTLSGPGFTKPKLLTVAATLGGPEIVAELASDPKGEIAKRVEELERKTGRTADDVLSGKAVTPPPSGGGSSHRGSTPRGGSPVDNQQNVEKDDCIVCGTPIPKAKMDEHVQIVHPEAWERMQQRRSGGNPNTQQRTDSGNQGDRNRSVGPQGNPKNAEAMSLRDALDYLETRGWDATTEEVDNDKPKGEIVSITRDGNTNRVKVKVSKGKPTEKQVNPPPPPPTDQTPEKAKKEEHGEGHEKDKKKKKGFWREFVDELKQPG